MAERFREDIPIDVSDTISTLSYYSSVNGSCTSGPGAADYPWGEGSSTESIRRKYSYRSMQDVVTSGFEKKRAQGLIINNPMEQTFIDEEQTPATYDINYMLQKYGCTPNRWYDYRPCTHCGEKSIAEIFGSTNVFLEPPENAVNEEALSDIAINAAWANISQAKMLALSSMAEANQTVDGLVDLMKKVNKIVRAVRRKDLKCLQKSLSVRELSEIYMNARYNLRPLMYDAKALLALFEERGQATPERQTFRSRTSDKYVNSDLIEGTTVMGQGGFYAKASLSRHVTVNCQVRAGVLTQVDQATDLQKLGLDSILESLYDLTPYSFIVDWFTNLGDTIMAYTPNYGMEPMASWIVKETTVIQTSSIAVHDLLFSPYYSVYKYDDRGSTASGGLATRIERKKVRIPNYDRSPFPRITLNLDPLKLLDLGIIIANVRKNASYVRTGM